MQRRVLPTQLVSLIHHVELNQAGWNDKAIQRLLIAAVWMSSTPTTLDRALDFLSTELRVRIGRARAARQVTALSKSGVLLHAFGGSLKLSESAVRGFEAELHEAERIQASARGKFAGILSENCPDVDASQTWSHFNSALLHPMVQEIGASTLGIVSGQREAMELSRLDSFLQQYPPSCRWALSKSIREFIDPRDAEVRQFLLRLLTAHFMVEAISLRKETIEAILATANPVFDIYLDTNFVFSVLGLHDNPANDAAKALVALVAQISPQMQARLMVLPSTLDEARKVLHAAASGLGLQTYPPRLAKATLEAGLMSGISRTFMSAAANSPSPLSPEEHFRPYAANLSALLQSHGIAVAQADLREIMADDEVQLDVDEQLHFEQTKFLESAKGRDQLEHDIVLWHYVHDQRPPRPESPASARSWVVTIDYRLLGFDSFKVNSIGDLVPVCLHPTSLIHMLTFWIPRTQEFEEALVSSMQLPFLFTEFDEEAEKVSLRIVSALARYEGADTISPDGIQAILLNEALRERIANESGQEAQVALIRDAIVQEKRVTEEKLTAAQLRVGALSAELTEKQESVGELSAALGRAVNSLEQERMQRETLSAQLASLQSAIAADRASTTRRVFTLLWAGILLGAVAAANVLAAKGNDAFPSVPPVKLHALSTSLTLLLWLLAAHFFASRTRAVKESRFWWSLNRLRRWIFGTLLVAILANAIWYFISM